MTKALIVSDNASIAHTLQDHFSREHWSSNSISIPVMMGQNSAAAGDYRCMVVVVDTDFQRRFGAAMDEIADLFRNLSRRTSLYLVFEGDYDSSFASWLEHTKRLFKKTIQLPKLQDAMDEIIRLETKADSRAPADAI